MSAVLSQRPPTTHSYLLKVAYDGARFHGFVVQGQARTVASVLGEAIAQMDSDASALRAVSRTDAGVHAVGQFCAFDSKRDIPSRGWALGINRNLPPDVGVVGVTRVPHGFEPRRKTRAKRYRYRILRQEPPDPLLAGRAWRVRHRLDVALMDAEARSLEGTHDFQAFRSSKDIRTDTVRTLTSVHIEEEPHDPRCLVLTVEGDRFLYRMVRVIAGTLVDVGRQRLLPGVCAAALADGCREELGVTAPAGGLTLSHIELTECGWDPWPIK